MKKNKFNVNEMNVVNSGAEAPKSTIKSSPSKRKLKAAKNSNKSWHIFSPLTSIAIMLL